MIVREARASAAAALAALCTQLGYPALPGEAAHRFDEREGFRRAKAQAVFDREL